MTYRTLFFLFLSALFMAIAIATCDRAFPTQPQAPSYPRATYVWEI